MRCFMVGTWVLLLLTSGSLAAAMEGNLVGPGIAGGHTYSGDDAYDPAAGGTPELSVFALPGRAAPAAAGTLSGDDDYDPAAGSAPELSVVALPQRAAVAASTFGGDDAYDPAAGVSALAICALSADEIAARSALTINGGYSGDDDYDPAAGGAPELSLLAFVNDDGLVANCDPVASAR